MANRSETPGSLHNATIDDLNKEMVDSIIPVLVFIGLLSVIGIFGNTSVLMIYSKRYPKCNFKYFVLILAALDSLSCTVLMPLEIATFVHWFVFPSAALCKFKSALNVFTVTASGSCLLLIAIDRYRKVCRPHSTQIKPELALKLTGVVLCLSAIPAASDGVFWGLHTHNMQYKGTNVTATLCEKDDRFKNTIWPMLHTTILYTGCNVVVMVTTLVLYTFIARHMFCQPGPTMTPEITLSSADNQNTSSERTIFKLENDIAETESERSNRSAFASRLPQGLSLEESSGTAKEDVKNTSTCSSMGQARLPARKDWSNTLEVLDSNTTKSKEQPFHEIPVATQKSTPNLTSPKLTSMPATSKPLCYQQRPPFSTLKYHTDKYLRRKTAIMFILTVVFTVTTWTYLAIISNMAFSHNMFDKFSVTERAVWLFFLRLYFINSVINPLLYGLLDTRFRQKLWDIGIRVRWLSGSIKRGIRGSIRRRKHSSLITITKSRLSVRSNAVRPRFNTTL